MNVQVPNSNSGTWGTTITSNGTKDLGSSFSYRYIKVQVPNTCTSTYTFPANDTGGTKDLGATNDTRYVNASNVYSKGKSDGVSGIINIHASSVLSETETAYTKVYTYTFPSAGTFRACYGYGEATNHYGHGSGTLEFYVGSERIMRVRVDDDSSTSTANINGNSPYDRDFSVSAGTEISIYRQEYYIDGQSGGTLRGSINITGYFKPNT